MAARVAAAPADHRRRGHAAVERAVRCATCPTRSSSIACRRRTTRGRPRRRPRASSTCARSTGTCRSSPTASCCRRCCACCRSSSSADEPWQHPLGALPPTPDAGDRRARADCSRCDMLAPSITARRRCCSRTSRGCCRRCGIDLIHARRITWDAEPSEPVELPRRHGAGLAAAPRTRVFLIDGLSAETAQTLPTWSSLCKRGLDARPSTSASRRCRCPSRSSLWTGPDAAADRHRVPLRPADRCRRSRTAFPAQVPGSRAVAENHGYIVRSLGFSQRRARRGPRAAKDADPETWATQWQARALEAVASDAPLVFVHVLRVDSAGHKQGRDSPSTANAAREADAILAKLVDAGARRALVPARRSRPPRPTAVMAARSATCARCSTASSAPASRPAQRAGSSTSSTSRARSPTRSA